MITEAVFKKRLMAKLKKIPLSWWESVNQVSVIGTPDILGCVNSKFVAIECKRNNKSKISPMQKIKLENINRCKGLALLATPENEADVLAQIERLLI